MSSMTHDNLLTVEEKIEIAENSMTDFDSLDHEAISNDWCNRMQEIAPKPPSDRQRAAWAEQAARGKHYLYD